ncbi:DNA ligase [Photobacterium sp. SDRW27]|uniref:DNA ligase n=1 Tax=Photobacterium obscurum TaxID=2829490 RepID=UPI00224368FF|nr:DNA ligase [Photobacterium obscurum]MCW8329980.1 DNA ligase [Photobacterium obscurum]
MRISFPTMPPSGLSRLAATITLILSPFHLEATGAPDTMQAKNADITLFTASDHTQNNINAYYISEKLDGIRAVWTGRQLVTRSGNPISAPSWFTTSLPKNVMLDGELWIGPGTFQQVAATVLDHNPDNEQWQKVKFMVFDLPSSNDRFALRLDQLKAIVTTVNRPHIRVLPQHSLDSTVALENQLNQITEAGGEGLMLHHKDNLYHQGRSELLLKIKHHQDAEAIVIGYEEGRGKYKGKMGAVWVLTAGNKKFKIGSGFTDSDRESPPQLGTIINYRYNGYTDSGIPRFARFIRTRPDSDI